MAVEKMRYAVISFMFGHCVEYDSLSRCPHGMVELFATHEEAVKHCEFLGTSVAPHILLVSRDTLGIRDDTPS